jgi:hypothetical protein
LRKAEKRLNSEFYDDVLKKLNILKLQEKHKLEQSGEESKKKSFEKLDKEDHNTESRTLSSDKFLKKQSELSDIELDKIKFFNEINSIVAISELNTQDALKFINEQKMTNICFIIDPEKDFNKKNDVDFRYEMVIEGENMISLKFDPTGNMLTFEYFSFVYYSIVCFFVCGWGLYYCLKSIKHDFDFLKYYRDIYSSKILISKINIEGKI